MNLYVFNICILLLCFFVLKYCSVAEKSRNEFYIYGMGLYLFLIHALKNPYSFSDTPAYAEAFEYMGAMGWKVYSDSGGFILKSEIGYVVLMWVISLISTNIQTIFIVTSFIIVGGYFRSIYKYSFIPWLSILLLLITNYNMSMFVLRQFIAMVICYNLFDYIINRKMFRFLIGVIIAFSIHQTAFIFLPLYFIYPITLSRKFYVYLIITILVLGWLATVIYNYIGDTFVGYESYIDGSQEGTNGKGFWLLLVVYLLYIRCLGVQLKKEGVNKLLFLALSLGVVISFVGVGLVATSRLNMYYSGLLYLVIPNMLYQLKRANERLLLGLGICAFFAFYFFRDLPTSYLFFWE
jgi:transmembrane protein EpsG